MVRLSKFLVKRILKNALDAMGPATTQAMAYKVDDSWGQKIYDSLFANVKPLVLQLPDGWVLKTKHFSVHEINGKSIEPLCFSLAQPQPWPLVFPDTELACPLSNASLLSASLSAVSTIRVCICLKKHPTWDELCDSIEAKKAEFDAAKRRRDQFVFGVKKILESCSTLHQACSIWPPLWTLVPDDVRHKYPDIPNRRIKSLVVPNVDLEQLTALLVDAKLRI